MNYLTISVFTCIILSCLFSSCQNHNSEKTTEKINIIIDTDANNELDDQHALAYAFCNSDDFNVVGITVNSTRVGNGIEGHYREAVRIARLCEALGKIPVKKGAEATFDEIKPSIEQENYDGKEAVNFIIEQSRIYENKNLTIVAIGKLTNIALAIEKDPEIINRVKLLWLGSNYPDPGEYNLENDTTSLNPVIQSGIEMDIALVAYGRQDGTDAVKIPITEIEKIMPGLGPVIADSIEGRNGGYFNNFGDYAVNLWQNMELYGEEEVRSLFDLAALVILKEPAFAERKLIKMPVWKNAEWNTQSNPEKKIGLYYNFQKDSILNEFFSTLNDYELPVGK